MKKSSIAAAVIFNILFLQFAGILCSAIPAKERAALIALYNSTNGDNWVNNTGWKAEPLESDGFGPSGSEEAWRGISISEDHVTTIFLPLLGLSGNIPPELGDLTYLKNLFLEKNDLSGTIPPDLGNLSHLEILELSSNRLSGSIPPEFANLDNVEILYIDDNRLTTIPEELGDMDNLEILHLDHNQLTSIPPELGNVDNLVQIFLENNQITTIPPELGNLAKLEWLYLNFNQLTSIPPQLENLSQLKCLVVNDNQLTSIPSELGNLKNMQILSLSSNQLITFPPEIWKFNNLSSLGMYNCGLTGSIPSELGNLTDLDTLVLSSNQLTGPIPSCITNLTALTKYNLSLGYNALFTNDDSVRAFLNERDADWEETQTIAPSNVSAAAISNSSIRVTWTPITYSGDTGGYKVYYSTSSGGPWIYAGMTPDKSTSSYDLADLIPETTYYFIVKTQTDPHGNNVNTVVSDESEEVSAVITTIPPEQDQPPFGSMDLPLGGDTPLSGSITVSGWALDDVEVVYVKIYNVVGNSETYIGDAVFVEGARTDIELAYPGYPNNKSAGWGYMLLSNFLPNGGNGAYTLRAIASDFRGQKTTLGSKTIISGNANAVKPFGAIDTPLQGGTASGSNYRNQGWVLTPMPNKIPVDGSTINVYVDGVFLGRPTYNVYREDIVGLFPGYANSDGAHAYFDFDTTGFTDGVHTIYWTATDNAGNADGIGSRYFSVQNSTRRSMAIGHCSLWKNNLSRVPLDDSTPVLVKGGYNPHAEPVEFYPTENGTITVEITELERVEMRLFPGRTVWDPRLAPLYSGSQIAGNQLRPLPIGSTLDTEKGVFYWSPGPGFIGTYQFVFVEKSDDGAKLKHVAVRIAPH